LRPLQESRRLLLESEVPEIPFRAVLTVRLDPREWAGRSRIDLDTLFDRLRDVAQERTRRFSAVHCAEAEQAINVRLSREPSLGTGAVVGIALAVDEVMHTAALHHLELRRIAALEEEKHRARVAEWARLRDQVLHDPRMARLWWLDGRADRLRDLVAMGDVFEQASQLLDGAPTESSADGIARLLREFLSRLTPEQRSHLLLQVARVFRSYEHDDLAVGVESAVPLPDQAFEVEGTRS
jgi:uncharacterized protein YbjQ (UPF0145 family)